MIENILTAAGVLIVLCVFLHYILKPVMGNYINTDRRKKKLIMNHLNIKSGKAYKKELKRSKRRVKKQKQTFKY